jgi:hypothetical protein
VLLHDSVCKRCGCGGCLARLRCAALRCAALRCAALRCDGGDLLLRRRSEAARGAAALPGGVCHRLGRGNPSLLSSQLHGHHRHARAHGHAGAGEADERQDAARGRGGYVREARWRKAKSVRGVAESARRKQRSNTACIWPVRPAAAAERAVPVARRRSAERRGLPTQRAECTRQTAGPRFAPPQSARRSAVPSAAPAPRANAPQRHVDGLAAHSARRKTRRKLAGAGGLSQLLAASYGSLRLSRVRFRARAHVQAPQHAGAGRARPDIGATRAKHAPRLRSTRAPRRAHAARTAHLEKRVKRAEAEVEME